MLSNVSIVFTFLLGFLPFFASAQCTTDVCRIIESTVNVFNRVVVILVLLALAAFGWGIAKLILAAQNPEERKKAKSIIVWSIAGMFIIASLAGIIKFGQDYFGVGGSTTIPAPKLP